MRKALKILRKTMLAIIVLLILLVAASKVLEDKIVHKAVTVINTQLDVPIFVEDIKFTILKQFPYATLQLNNFTILSSKHFNTGNFNETYADTLVYFDQLYLSANIIKLAQNKLDITKAFAKKGQINILVDKAGHENYNIFNTQLKSKNKNSSADKLTFMLDQVQLKQINIRFINKYKSAGVVLYAPNYTVKGQFYKNEYTASSKGKLLLHLFEQGNIVIKPTSPATVVMNGDVNNKQINIQQGSIKTDTYFLTTSGKIKLKTPIELDLKINGNINEIERLLKDAGLNWIDKYNVHANLGLAAVIRGPIDNKISPIIATNFKVLGASIKNEERQLNVENIQITGSFSNGSRKNLATSSLKIESFSAGIEHNKVSGNMKLTNFKSPYLQAKLNLDASLNELNKFVQLNSEIDGNLNGEANIYGNINLNNEWLKSIEQCSKSGHFKIVDGSFYDNNFDFHVAKLNAALNLNNEDLNITNAVGDVQNSSTTAKVTIHNYFKIITDSTYPVAITGSIQTNYIDYDNYKKLFENNDTEHDKRSYIIGCNFHGKRLKYNKLVAENAVAKIMYKKNELAIENFSFDTFDGKINGRFNLISGKQNNVLVNSHAKTNKVNIKSLFETFDNFDQKFIVSENLGGYLTSDIDIEMIYRNGKIDTSTIELLGHLRIDDGELKNFELFNEVARFSEMETMEHIKFSSLENDILITNSTVFIPKMELSSNAFDISVNGLQKFSGDYEYHLKINAGDFLVGKAKRLSRQQTEFGYVEDDGYGRRNLYLLATRTNEKSKVRLDADQTRAIFKEKRKEEKQEFKRVLRNEFGWFKNDTTLNTKKETKEKQEFIIEWDEE